MIEYPVTVFYRTVEQKRTTYQLYWPGFEPTRNMWLIGKWVPCGKPEWTQVHETYQQFWYTAIHCPEQVSSEDLARAKRIAERTHRGATCLAFRDPDNEGIREFGCRIHGNRVIAEHVKLFKERGWKVLRYVNFDGNAVVDTLEGLVAPPWDIEDNKDSPIDMVAERVKFWAKTSYEDGLLFLSKAADDDELYPVCSIVLGKALFAQEDYGPYASFNVSMSLKNLLELEKSLVRTRREQRPEHSAVYRGYYVQLRAALQTVLGSEFSRLYQFVKSEYNSDINSRQPRGGFPSLFFVLPEVNEDGSFGSIQ
jgi:hypothetical protein